MEPFRILEWMATFVESIVILSTIAAASEKRQQNLRYYCLLVLSAVSLTVLIGFMNSISAFSFLTPLVAMCFIVSVLSYILSDGTLLVRSTTCIMAYFVVVTMGKNLYSWPKTPDRWGISQPNKANFHRNPGWIARKFSAVWPGKTRPDGGLRLWTQALRFVSPREIL